MGAEMPDITDAALDALWDDYCDAARSIGNTGDIDVYDIDGMFEAAQAMWDAITALRADVNAWKSQCEGVEREAAKCFAAQQEIDVAWDAFGASGNRKTLSLAEQIASHQREVDDARACVAERDAAYARGVHDAATWIESVPNVLANRQEIARSIRALADAPPVPVVRVLPLVWYEGDEPDEWKSGPYDVWCELGRFQLYYWSIVMGKPHDDADAAKAAAQADYEARILAALQPQSEGGDA
jgi:hypothetical protein